MWRAFYEMRRHLDRVIERQLAETGLSSADYDLLSPLSEAPPGGLRARDLGNLVGWDRSRLSHQIRRMEQRGLLIRRECPTDARGTVIDLTQAGRAAIEAAAPGHVDNVRRHFVDLLSPEEVDTMTAIATRVLDRATDRPAPETAERE